MGIGSTNNNFRRSGKFAKFFFFLILRIFNSLKILTNLDKSLLESFVDVAMMSFRKEEEGEEEKKNWKFRRIL